MTRMEFEVSDDVRRLIREAERADDPQTTIAVSLIAIAKILLHAHDSWDAENETESDK